MKCVIYYFYDFPTHKDKLNWNTHTAEICYTRKSWLDGKSDTGTSLPNSKSPDQANVADKFTNLNETSESTSVTSDITSSLAEAPDVHALLASDLVQLGGSQHAQDLISDSLNVTNELIKRHVIGIILAILCRPICLF